MLKYPAKTFKRIIGVNPQEFRVKHKGQGNIDADDE